MAMKQIKVLLIESTDSWTVREIVETELHKLVGGNPESVTVEYADDRNRSVVLWYNGEGETENLPPNLAATAFWYRLDGGRDDVLLGSVIVTGAVGEDGLFLAVPDNVVTNFTNLVR